MTNRDAQTIVRFRNGETLRTAGAVEIDLAHQTVRFPDEDQGEAAFGELKAVFFLRDETKKEPVDRGSILTIEFSDGEVLRGIAPEYNPTLPGFYLYPKDEERVERVFVVASAIVSIDVERL